MALLKLIGRTMIGILVAFCAGVLYVYTGKKPEKKPSDTLIDNGHDAFNNLSADAQSAILRRNAER